MNEQRKWTIVLMTITVFMATAIFFSGLVGAGDLEPGAPPGSTMKTLDEVPPTWSQKLPASERFVPVLDSAGVLDKETGLVWERSPDTTQRDWDEACYHCYQRVIGGRLGWRLPTVEELASLVDTTNINPALPPGHLFSNVQSAYYWSSNTHASNTDQAWLVDLGYGNVGGIGKHLTCYVWCVRGGHGHDGY